MAAPIPVEPSAPSRPQFHASADDIKGTPTQGFPNRPGFDTKILKRTSYPTREAVTGRGHEQAVGPERFLNVPEMATARTIAGGHHFLQLPHRSADQCHFRLAGHNAAHYPACPPRSTLPRRLRPGHVVAPCLASSSRCSRVSMIVRVHSGQSTESRMIEGLTPLCDSGQYPRCVPTFDQILPCRATDSLRTAGEVGGGLVDERAPQTVLGILQAFGDGRIGTRLGGLAVQAHVGALRSASALARVA